jgi:aryl-alcohol dehydrogenase-like predicted oxidoreductase
VVYQYRRVAFLHTYDAPRRARNHLICVIQDALRRLGVDVVDIYGIDAFVPADLLFVHYDRSLVPEAICSAPQGWSTGNVSPAVST